MVVDIACQVVKLIEIINRPAVLCHRRHIILDDGISLRHRHFSCFIGILKNLLGAAHHPLILLQEGIAPAEDGGGNQIVLAQLIFIFHIDNRYIEKLKPGDMRFGEQSIF